MFDIALGIFLFLSPIIIMSGQNARLNGAIAALQFYQFKTLSFTNNILQLQFFQYGILILFIIALTQKTLRDFKDKYIAWFLGLCALSVVFHPKTISTFTLVFLGVLLYYLVVKYTKDIKKLLYVIVLISVLNTLFAILQFFNIHLIYKPTGNINGLMCLSSHLGTYQTLAIPICFSIHPLFSLIPLTGVLLSQSILAISISIAYLIYAVCKRYKVILTPMYVIGLISLFSIILLKNFRYIIYKLSLRLDIWFETIKLILEKWYIGYGIGTFNLKHNLGFVENPYSIYLELGYILGIVGLIFSFVFLKDRFFNYKNKTNLGQAIFASCLMLALIGLGQSFMDFPRLAGTVIVLFAFLEIFKRLEVCY